MIGPSARAWCGHVVGDLAMGATLGAINGMIIVRSGLHSFVITLETMSIFFGVMIFMTQAESYREISSTLAGSGTAVFACSSGRLECHPGTRAERQQRELLSWWKTEIPSGLRDDLRSENLHDEAAPTPSWMEP